MQTVPLQPFAPPAFLLSFLPAQTLSAGTLVTWFLFAVFCVWTVYTLVAIYHWLKYSHASKIAYPSIALHLFVSFILAVFTLSGTLPL